MGGLCPSVDGNIPPVAVMIFKKVLVVKDEVKGGASGRNGRKTKTNAGPSPYRSCRKSATPGSLVSPDQKYVEKDEAATGGDWPLHVISNTEDMDKDL